MRQEDRRVAVFEAETGRTHFFESIRAGRKIDLDFLLAVFMKTLGIVSELATAVLKLTSTDSWSTPSIFGKFIWLVENAGIKADLSVEIIFPDEDHFAEIR